MTKADIVNEIDDCTYNRRSFHGSRKGISGQG